MDPMQELESSALDTLQEVKTLTITNADTYRQAGEALKRIKTGMAEVRSYFRPVIEAAHRSHKEAVAQENRALFPYIEAELVLKAALVTYQQAEDTKRREQEAALNQESALLSAIEAAEQGDEGMADAILNGEVTLPPVIVPSATPKVEGIQARQRWAYKITDPARLPREYLKPDEGKIANVVKAMKGACAIPGVVVFQEMTISAGRTP